ncbi:hypothetical protein EZJ49_14960 [Bdellovibrio bacteriovorus]|uniref:hypothetical protein n=1 Tax=Bdellovibrio bacteriovorus TaxID=959 RepID=UPI0021CDF198|nr:hypothetical protein [Bdellovibrio bacteriovorus]UXR64367.1 hypothetical protein EZJ49_14960 [Bdellovibrio bacteriovorus]
MSFTDKKLEIAIAGFALLMIGGMGYLLKSPVQNAISEMEVIYEMPRPKSILAALFDLGDREISRDYKNPFAKKKDDAKKVDAKTAAPQQAPAKAVAKKADSKKTPTPIKKPSVEVNVVGAAPASGLNSDDITVGDGNGQQNYQQETNNKKTAENTETKNTLSGDQWRALLQAQPSKENVDKLVAAYSAKEVDDQTFYTIVTELLRSNKTETQDLGLAALKGTYSEKSFAVVAQYYDQFAPEVQTKLHTYMLSYAVSGRMGILMSVLKSDNAELVTAATQVVMEGYVAAKAGTNLNDPRGSRGDVVINSVDGYAKFIPVFQQLAQSQDSEIAGMASAALSQIQTAAVAAL